MIASFMLYASIVTGCLALAALAIESLFRQLGRPLRFVWINAFVTAIVLLALAPLRRESAPAAGDLVPTLSTRFTTLPFSVAPSPASVPDAATNLLLIVWLAGSAALLLLVAGVQLRYRRLRDAWPSATLGGATVRLSPTFGPAVMGIWEHDIVVPAWLLERGDGEQSIVVAHEREHLRARDPLLLESALLVVLLMPWNAALWWMLSRLRLAVELDCDARVLRAGTAPQVYGNLLLDVAALHAGHRAPALALLDPPSNLHRRLMAMRPQSVRFTRLRVTAAGIIATGALIVACQAELPTDRTVSQMDASTAERMATTHLGDSVRFIVDGKVVEGRVAQKIAPDQIASVKVDHGDGDGGPAWISVTTNQNGVAKTNSVAYKTLYTATPDTGYKAEALRVMASVHDAIGFKVMHGVSSEKEGFHGLLFINGKRADPSELEKMRPMDLKSVEVLKSPEARKQYADPAAAFGVIKVITK